MIREFTFYINYDMLWNAFTSTYYVYTYICAYLNEIYFFLPSQFKF